MNFLDTNGLKKLIKLILGYIKPIKDDVEALKNKPSAGGSVVGNWDYPAS